MAVFDVATAAARLGVDETEVCRRITDGSLMSLRARGGGLCVFMDEAAPSVDVSGHPVQPARTARTDAEIIATLRAQITEFEGVCASLRDEVELSQRRLSASREREAHLTESLVRAERTSAMPSAPGTPRH